MAESTGLLNLRGETLRGFESLSLRHYLEIRATNVALFFMPKNYSNLKINLALLEQIVQEELLLNIF